MKREKLRGKRARRGEKGKREKPTLSARARKLRDAVQGVNAALFSFLLASRTCWRKVSMLVLEVNMATVKGSVVLCAYTTSGNSGESVSSGV